MGRVNSYLAHSIHVTACVTNKEVLKNYHHHVLTDSFGCPSTFHQQSPVRTERWFLPLGNSSRDRKQGVTSEWVWWLIPVNSALGAWDRIGLSSRSAQLPSEALSQQNKNLTRINSNNNKHAHSSVVLYLLLIYGQGRWLCWVYQVISLLICCFHKDMAEERQDFSPRGKVSGL